MANSYDAQAATPAAEEPAPAQAGGKVSQQQANYRMGNPQRSCGLCANFTGSAGDNAYQCTKVAGEISPYGFSDEYARQDNPFIAGVQEGFDAGGETESPAEDTTAMEEPELRLQIGNRSYR